MTRRERLTRKVELREGWAEKAIARSDTAFDKAHKITDAIPLGQPILISHHSEGMHRAAIRRSDSAMSKAVERSKMAVRHEQVADGIRKQLDHSIFTDDAGAIDALRERIAGREAECERIKAYNLSCRKTMGTGDLHLLDDKQRENLFTLWRVAPYQSKNGQYPAYALTNLRSCITKDRKRLDEIVMEMGA